MTRSSVCSASCRVRISPGAAARACRRRPAPRHPAASAAASSGCGDGGHRSDGLAEHVGDRCAAAPGRSSRRGRCAPRSAVCSCVDQRGRFHSVCNSFRALGMDALEPALDLRRGVGRPRRRSGPARCARSRCRARGSAPTPRAVPTLRVVQVAQHHAFVGQRGQRVEAHGGVVVVVGIQLWMYAFPEAVEQGGEQAQPDGEAGHALQSRGWRAAAARPAGRLWCVRAGPGPPGPRLRHSGSTAGITVSPNCCSGLPCAAASSAVKAGSYSRSSPQGEASLTGACRASTSSGVSMLPVRIDCR